MNSTTYYGDLISEGKSQELSYRTLHAKATIQTSTKEQIQIPYMSLTNKYKDFLSEIVTEITLEGPEHRKYKCNPKGLSLYLYGTTEYWYSLLELNNMISIIDFNKNTIKVYDPTQIKSIINEIFILEGLMPE